MFAMKKSIQRLFGIGILAVAFGAATVCYGQITGGYGDTSTTNPNVVAASNFAVKQGAKKSKIKVTLVKIEKARIQIVAGLNYEVCLEVRVKRGRKFVTEYAKAVVYKDLQNRYSLTTWFLEKEQLFCGEPNQ